MPLEPDTEVLNAEGALVPVRQLCAGDRLLALDHASRSVRLSTLLGFQSGAGASIVLDRPDLGLFVAGQRQWCKEALPVSLLRKLPQQEPRRLLNVGSQWHQCAGHECTPCTWNLTRGCRDGLLCGYCHCEHPNMSRSAIRKRSQRSTQVSHIFELAAFMDQTALHMLESICQGSCPDKVVEVQEASTADSESDSPAMWSDEEADSSCETEPQIVVKGTFLQVVKPALRQKRSRSAPTRSPDTDLNEEGSSAVEVQRSFKHFMRRQQRRGFTSADKFCTN